MGHAPVHSNPEHLQGQFVESEHGHDFEYTYSEGDAFWSDFPQRVYVGCDQWRYARVTKTRAYVVVDEADDGSPVVEKWVIRHRWSR